MLAMRLLGRPQVLLDRQPVHLTRRTNRAIAYYVAARAGLLPPAEARAVLAEARAIAEGSGRRRLLEEIARQEAP